mgnify:CR=1 FL=1
MDAGRYERPPEYYYDDEEEVDEDNSLPILLQAWAINTNGFSFLGEYWSILKHGEFRE